MLDTLWRYLSGRPAARHRCLAMAGGPRLYRIPITCCLDGRAHDVTDENVAAGRTAGGRYQALCGHVVLPAALVAPIGRPCALCATVLAMAHRPRLG